MAPGYWSRSLRVIGQQLSHFRPVSLEIEVSGNSFVIRGGSTIRPQSPDVGVSGGTLKYWLKHAEKEVKSVREQPVLQTFEIELSAVEINRLDEEWAKNRRRVGQHPDLYNLYELLRTVGRYVDSERGHLVRISKDCHTLVLQYRDRNNTLKTLECSMLSLYKNQQKMIAERGTFIIKDLWEHRDW